MSKKAKAPLRIAPLQGVIAVPITDPAEQAALDKLRQRLKRKRVTKAEETATIPGPHSTQERKRG